MLAQIEFARSAADIITLGQFARDVAIFASGVFLHHHLRLARYKGKH